MSAAVMQRRPWAVLEGAAAFDVPVRYDAACSCAPWHHDADEVQNRATVDAYRRAGGLLSGDEVAALLREHSPEPISLLARWIVTRRVVSIVWQSQTLIPMFQFDRADMSLRLGPTRVVDELADTFDAWELAAWFVEPNSWLQDAAPVDVIDFDLPAVLQAARADRFIARG
jgi:hypothetical protein